VVAVDTTGTVGTVAFDAGTQTLTYSADAASQDALAAGQTATDTFSYTVSDTQGATSTASVTVTVTGVNDAPVVANPVPDQNAQAGSAFSLTVATNTFFDVDAGDVLSYSATRADGSALPSWLAFNPATRTFSGTPASGDAGSLNVRITATDQGGLSASDNFAVNVTAGLNTITGTEYNDDLVGTDAADLILGLGGDDTISGGLGNDVIDGGQGTNFLDGGAGDDVFLQEGPCRSDRVTGGAGFDQVLGGTGNDTISLFDFFGDQTVEKIDGGAGTNVIAGQYFNDTLDFSGTELVNISRIDSG